MERLSVFLKGHKIIPIILVWFGSFILLTWILSLSPGGFLFHWFLQNLYIRSQNLLLLLE